MTPLTPLNEGTSVFTQPTGEESTCSWEKWGTSSFKLPPIPPKRKTTSPTPSTWASQP